MKAILELFKKIFAFFSIGINRGEDIPPAVEQPIPSTIEDLSEEITFDDEWEENEEDDDIEEPEEPETNYKEAKVKSILWKPESDNDGNPVVLVSCDNVHSEDLKIEIRNKNGNKMRVGIQNTGRANQEAHCKFGRVHFRLDRSAERFKKASPIEIRVIVEKTGKKSGKNKSKIIKRIKVRSVESRKYILCK
jgi:hypothetical protein